MTPRELQLKLRDLRLRERELRLRRLETRYRSRSAIADGGIKGLALINGVGAVALLAFFQSTISNADAVDLLPFIMIGIAFHALGLASASIVFAARYMQSRREDDQGGQLKQDLWGWATWALCLASVAFFVIGVGAVVYGGLTQLDVDDNYDESAQTVQA